MRIKIQQWGNSAAIRLPSAALKQMGLISGDILSLDVSEQTMTLTPLRAKPHYRLEDLMAQCDVNAPEPEDLAAWKAMQPTGREV